MNLFQRAAAPLAISRNNLGPLAELAGNWVGHGYNMIAVPDHQNHKPFRLIVNATKETLAFTPIGGPVPNRGSLQNDIDIFGLTYLQQVNDAATDEGIHIEPGIWLHVPATSDPKKPATIVRQSTIPHGDSLLAGGESSCEKRAPHIAPASTEPHRVDGKPLPFGYTDPYQNGKFPPGFDMKNPNQALVDVLQYQQQQLELKVVETINLKVSTNDAGGITNIPFIVKNANATHMDAIFWIETVQRPDGSQFMQLQYTQTVLLVFEEIVWPHVSVATLLKR
ncbi:hypothetical protein KIF53_05665 [Chromobacterium subtsugae]|uniref:THAP4-like heme-binding beta-barrel domain-containing protein n=1 Tax=Chromobacterium subtsugae TaxID=251747 RepID=A0ABS7FAK4_9NEIS|nr:MULTISPECIES: heme-binding protein [Chromobacterium]KUM02161.1 hypothetical protein Cv017_04630 [Chromobacterium subtsugae]KZE87203.1 hypothetical protein AWB61_12735 [Chromobacterium sp. F49]MBW7565845.1 hypothetical protein [Chromobacterium subtsugae]MBW8287115.1 hypothetical protein [Chromobacterium subtsugae]WSE93191.1 heme-binding protein [Chromobacterium subtsugae]